MRRSLLDIHASEGISPARPATVLGMQIQPVHRLLGSQQHGQLQLCVPPMALKGDSYRLKDRDLGRVPTTTTDDR